MTGLRRSAAAMVIPCIRKVRTGLSWIKSAGRIEEYEHVGFLHLRIQPYP